MMKVSTKTRYALRFLLELSTRSDTPVCITTKSIARHQGLSEKYLESIATKLRKAGYIKSIKGAGGGYILQANPANIRVGDIIRLMEAGFFQDKNLRADTGDNKYYNERVIIELFDRVGDQVADIINGITLADLIASFQE